LIVADTFEGRHVVVTGGAGSLGGKVVDMLLAEGAFCHVPCLFEAEYESFEAKHHPRVRAEHGVDLTDELRTRTYYDKLPADLWASIHCAGGFKFSPIQSATADDFKAMLMINAMSAFLCCREAIRVMRSSGTGGRIVNVGARTSLEPRLGASMSPYVASKSAVTGLTCALAEEVVRDGVLVNAVLPSIIDTPQNRKDMPDADFAAWATPEEVAATILFLASPRNHSTRGALVPVYGRS